MKIKLKFTEKNEYQNIQVWNVFLKKNYKISGVFKTKKCQQWS